MAIKKITYATICMTQAQQSFLKDYLKKDIDCLSAILKDSQEYASELWANCNPADNTTQGNYLLLNELKKEIKRMKKRLKNLQQVQQAVKGCLIDTFDVQVVETGVKVKLEEAGSLID